MGPEGALETMEGTRDEAWETEPVVIIVLHFYDFTS